MTREATIVTFGMRLLAAAVAKRDNPRVYRYVRLHVRSVRPKRRARFRSTKTAQPGEAAAGRRRARGRLGVSANAGEVKVRS